MNKTTKTTTMVGGMAVGAGLMYVFDSTSGRRRRALVRDKLFHFMRVSALTYSKASRDFNHRLHGIYSESKNRLRNEPVSDDILVERVRSQIGRAVSHPRAIQISSDHGRITLKGDVFAHEVHELLSGVAHVRSVIDVENQLKVHLHASDAPSLQGGKPQRSIPSQPTWFPLVRFMGDVISGTLATLTAFNLLKKRYFGAALSAGILGVFAKGVELTPPTQKQRRKPSGQEHAQRETLARMTHH